MQERSTIWRVLTYARLRALGLLLGLAGAAEAQQAGVIAGRVTGPEGNPVANVNVTVTGTRYRAITDRAGQFRIAGVPAGPRTVVAAYLGFRNDTSQVSVAADRDTQLAISMQLAPVVLAGIEVVGERAGQLRSINQERRSITVSDVISTDEIGSLPDQNVAEAVQRVPGVAIETSRGEGRTVSIRGIAPNLNNVTFNGQPLASTATDRSTPLDLLPASMVSSIEVIKAVTPDMDANTIGGTVNLQTLTAFDREGPFFFGSLEGLFHQEQVDYGDRRLPYELELTAGRRFGPGEQFGVVVAGSSSRRDYAVSVLDPDGWIRTVNRASPTLDSLTVADEIELQVADNQRDRYGITTNLDWRPRPETNLFLRGLYTRTRETESNSEFEITFTGDFLFDTPRAGRNSKGSLELDLSRSNELEQLVTLQAGGGQRWGALKLDVTGLFTRGESDYENPDATFENPKNSEAIAAIRLDFNPYFFRTDPENRDFVSNPANYNLIGASWNQRQTTESTVIGAADLRWDTRLGRFPTFFKLGTKLQNRDKDIDDSSDRYTNPALTLAPYALSPVTGGVQGSAGAFVHGNVGGFLDFFHRNRAGTDSLRMDPVNTRFQQIDGDAYVQERIAAAYLMGSAEFGRLSVLSGVRMEQTESDAEFYVLLENSRLPAANRYTFPNDLTRREKSYTHWLPSAILKFNATDDLILRAAYTNTLARPQYSQLARFTRANYLPSSADPNVFEGTVSAGNPELMPYEATNLDLFAEYYIPTGGQLSAGGFFKRVDNPIFFYTSTDRNITFDDRFFSKFSYSQWRNGEEGTFRGLEFSYAQPLFFLPRPLDGLGITANVAFIDSELKVQGRDDKLPFIGQPGRVINLIPYYQRGPFEARFAYAYRSDYLRAVERPGLDRYVDDRATMDLTIRYELAGPRLELIGTARNLANEPEVQYQGNRSQYDLHVLTGRTFSIGVRSSL